MGLIRNVHILAAGFGLGLIVSACASTFPFKYYGLDLKDGKLLGPTTADDLPLSDCAATAADESPCTAMQTSAFLALKKSYKDLQDQLVACQQGK